MPIYKVGDKKYDIPQEELESFLIEFPQAEEFIEGKTTPTDQDMSVDVTEVSEVTESPSEDGSLELEETKYKTPLTLEEKKSLQNNQFSKQMSKEDNFTKERLEELEEESLKEANVDSLGEYLVASLDKGDKFVWESVMSAPGALFSAAALISDPINRALGLPETDVKKFEESIGTRPIIESLIEEQENLGSELDLYEKSKGIKGGAYENFKQGNVSDGFVKLGRGLAESAPVSISMMMGGAAGASRLAMMAVATPVLAGPEIKTQREENPQQTELESVLKGFANAGAESFFEGIGSSSVGKVYKDIIFKEGKERGSKVFRNGLIEMYETAIKRFGVPATIVGGGIEEVATTMTQNLINEKPVFDNIGESFTQGVGGGGLYGAPVNISKSVEFVKDAVTGTKINSILSKSSDFELRDIQQAFEPIQPITEAQVEISKNKNSYKILDNKLKRSVLSGDVTNEQADAIRINFKQTQGTVNALSTLKLNTKDEANAVQLLKEKKQLKEQIKQVGEANLTIEQSDRIKEIDQDLKGIGSKAVTQEVDKIKKAAESIKDLDVQEFASTEETEAFLNEQGQDSKASGQQGFVIQNPKTGKQTIVINREVADREIAVAAPSHEFLHALLFSTVKNSPETQIALGNSLKEYIDKIDVNKVVKDSNFAKRLEQYKLDPDAVQAEEVLTLFSDAIRTEDIKFNEDIFTKIGDVVRKALQALGVKVKFNNGKDVYNFIKDYNKSLESTGLTKAQIKVAEGVKGKLVADKVQTDDQIIKESRSEEASARVQELYDAQGEAAAFDIIEQFKPITSKIVEKRSQAPGFDRQLLTDEIETGKRGILDLVREYDAESGVPLAAYINKFLPARAIEASRRILGEEFTDDVTEAKGVAAEEVSVDVTPTDKSTTSKLRRVLGIKQGDAIYDLAKEVSGEILSGDLPGKKVKTAINKEARKSKLRKAVSDLMGTEKAIDEQFLNKNILDIVKALPASDLVKLEREAKVKVLAEQGPRLNVKDAREAVNRGLLPKDTNLQSGPKVSSKLPVTLEQAKEFFTQKRKAGLVNVVTEMLVKDAAPEVTKDKMEPAKRAKVLSEIDRAPTLKFSKGMEEVIDNILDSDEIPTDVKKQLKALKENPTSPESIKIIEEQDAIRLALIEGITVEEFESRNEQESKNWKNAVPGIGKLLGVSNIEYRKPGELLNETNEKRTVDFFEEVVGFFPEISKLPKELLNALKATVATGKSLKRPDGTRLNVSWFNSTMKNVGKGKTQDWMGQVFQPNWGYGSKTKKSPKGSGFKGTIESKLDQLTENGKKTLTVKQGKEFVEFTRDFLTHPDLLDSVNENGFKNGYELTVAANRKAIKFIYNNLGEYYFSAKDKKTALEDINSFLQMQTNHANGIIKGLVPVISVTTNPEANPDFKEKVKGRTKTHNEHMVELFNANQRFLTILSEGKKGFKSKTTEMVKNLNQSLISKKAQGIKDSSEKGGASGQVSSNQFLNTFFTRDFSDDQLMIVGEQGESVTDYLIKNYGTQILKNILDKVTKVSSIKADSPIAIELEAALNSLSNYRNLPKKNNSILPKKEQLKGYYTTGQTIIKASKVDNENAAQESKFSRSLNLNKDFNDIIENKTGIASDKTYARVKAEVAGANKGKFNFFIPPSAEDFVGLLYSTLGKGSTGDAQMAWYKAHLLNPYARAMENIANDRANMMQDFRGLKKGLGIVPKNLRKKIKDSNFTEEQAVRAYIWDKQGMEIPGISKKDQKGLVDFVKNKAELSVFADQLIDINKGDAYAAPDAGWVAGNISTDFIKALNTTKRSKYLESWKQNKDVIFSEENLNKLEAAYGKNYREAMENMLKRMETGKNTSSGSDRLAARATDWLTNSVGAIMFFNTRSAVLQTISAVNFVNFSDNNILKAGQALANQPQYWKDFKKLFNSPFLLDRRSGLKLNVNEADIAAMAKGPGNGARNVIAGILKAGFLPTQLADSFAIASGGATFYRNRIKALEKEGLTRSEAEEQAFRDFREIAEESQQSSRPDKISQQQAGPLGRVILAFANTPAQYARLIKKAASDLKNGRGDAKTNISKIIYYGVAQNLLFSALQQALFAIAFDDDEEEEKKNEKYFNIVNGMSDSILRGIGIGGAIVSVVKNTALRLAKEADKKSPKYQDAVVKGILQISPPISSKIGKLQSAGRSYSWNQEEMRTRGWSIDNPAYLASANVISAATNVPLDRAVKKITNIVDAGNEDIEYYKRVALALGWSAWELGIDKKGGKVTPPKTDMDKLYDLTKKQQIDSLTNLGISKKQIKLLKLEEDRVNAILNPKSIKQIKVSKKDSLFGLNKKDQIQALEKLGLTKKEIRALRLESDRVEAIINKQKKEVK